ncbi:response regulator transcription factor [Marinobacterium weihaiense]|uniref:Response regulator transcription factor n=1 Tax=Marinobacterium weihaiense TaxID=2851016 RepID=A0ABS6M6G0_9GAMM|nr:response regulator transcription factor [Marinobacterium weihaiense]MBV0931876.1 response regulator transcription factor [Marinobacterium weihaiense]
MKILLTDDHAVVRQGYASLLAAMLESCEIVEASNGWDSVTLWQQHRPDAVILDINLPDISGMEAARRILQRDPEARILFFSMYDELPMVQQALDTGALGYITKSSSPEVLLEAVRKVLAGQPYVEHDLATRLAMQRNGGLDPRLDGMTQREFEIFVMLARGLTPKSIAEQLCISVKTVSNHSALLKNKLQVASTAELVHLAIQCGVLKLGPSG